jgi:hypothetical protein
MVGEVPPNLTMEPMMFTYLEAAQTLYLKSDWEDSGTLLLIRWYATVSIKFTNFAAHFGQWNVIHSLPQA